LVEATHEHALWSAFIDQIEVKPKGALVVIPRVGGARIHFDSLDDLEGKLNKLEVFYREQIARGNLNAYKTIDLAYKDQVVAQRYY
jgi:cell division protein FtsQ